MANSKVALLRYIRIARGWRRVRVEPTRGAARGLLVLREYVDIWRIRRKEFTATAKRTYGRWPQAAV